MNEIAAFAEQLSLFSASPSAASQPEAPAAIRQAMELGAALAVSVSGGKDSDAMLRHLVRLHRKEGWAGELLAITADLGRIEWPGTLEHIQAVCEELGVALVVVRRAKGGMIDRWDERRTVLKGQQSEAEAIASGQEGNKPFWSSSAARYCTKELKTAEVDRYLRQFDLVVCAVGIRADESSSRAKKPHYQVRGDITTSYLKPERGLDAGQQEDWAENAIALWLERERKGRLALTWNPVFDGAWMRSGER